MDFISGERSWADDSVGQQMNSACKKRYSKSSSFYTGVKAEFFSSNPALLAKAQAQNRLYAEQPLRLNCKLCAAPVPEARDFTSHGVGYKLCPQCGHLNGEHEETARFIETLYVDEGGSEYAKNYVDAGYATRVENIYLPKLDFMLEDAGDIGRPKVLDVGCGAGYFVNACLRRGLTATGIDLSRQMVEFGNAQMAAEFGVTPLTCVQEDEFFDAISASDADVISAIGVVEHLRSPQRFFDAFAKSSARYVFISVPMFSTSAIIENAFEDVFPRQLSGAHTPPLHRGLHSLDVWRARLVAARRVAVRQRRDGSLPVPGRHAEGARRIGQPPAAVRRHLLAGHRSHAGGAGPAGLLFRDPCGGQEGLTTPTWPDLCGGQPVPSRNGSKTMTIRTHERGLTVVTTNGVAVHRPDDSISQRVRRLQAEARGLAHEHVLALLDAIETVEALSADIADGGEAYPPGVRDIARRLAEDLATKAMTLEVLSGRAN